ncbi:MAG TPA: MFS transporter [Anaerolineae bacterium]
MDQSKFHFPLFAMSQAVLPRQVEQEPTTAEKIRKLPWSIAAYATNSVFVQFTFFGSAFVLLVSQLGLSKSQIGALLSFFPYAGLIALFIAPAVARFGYKRTYLTFFAARKLVTGGLLLTPLILARFGFQATLVYVYAVTLTFALCRAIGETGYYPWHQEYVPGSVRGRYSATNNMFSTLTGLVAVSVASFVIERSAGLSGYMWLIGVGVLFGLASVWCSSHVPGGAPVPKSGPDAGARRDFRSALADSDFLRFLFGASFITLAVTPMTSFLPLFMEEQVGISAGNVILIQTGTLVGGLISTYWWGWAADRYGSQPVALLGAFILVLLPVFWMAMPRYSELSLYVALAIALAQGIANMGWLIGSGRLYHVSIVPPAKKTDYMALYYAWVGIVGGTSQLLGGQLLQATAGISGQFLVFTIDPYVSLFALGLIFPLVSIVLLRGVQADSRVTVEEFAFMFLRGNPFRAMTSLVGYHLAKDEHAAVLVTESLGKANSPIAVDELLEALTDPRFNVRYEAVISIARMRPEPRLTEALVNLLQGSELALSVNAAWALGRIGDQTAIEALREGLNSDYYSIRAHCARALGTLGDTEIVPLLQERLKSEPDKGLQMAYASALGHLGLKETTGTLLQLLEKTANEGARMELALSLARLLGEEHRFIQLWRQTREEVGTAVSQAVIGLKRKVGKNGSKHDDFAAVIDACADAFARNDLARGVSLLGDLVEMLPLEEFDETAAAVLQECADKLDQFKESRLEYVLLTLHAISTGTQ